MGSEKIVLQYRINHCFVGIFQRHVQRRYIVWVKVKEYQVAYRIIECMRKGTFFVYYTLYDYNRIWFQPYVFLMRAQITQIKYGYTQ